MNAQKLKNKIQRRLEELGESDIKLTQIYQKLAPQSIAQNLQVTA